jgi:hypothetical protein
VSREDDFATEKTYSDGAGMFMAYDTLNSISETQISCYELVCADPVSGFVLDAVKSGFSAADTVENSSRFDVSTIFGLIKSFGTRSGSTKAIAYPYWENAARMVEDILTLLLILIILLVILPVIVAIVAVVKGCKFGIGKLRSWVPQIIEKRRERAYERRREAHGGR